MCNWSSHAWKRERQVISLEQQLLDEQTSLAMLLGVVGLPPVRLIRAETGQLAMRKLACAALIVFPIAAFAQNQLTRRAARATSNRACWVDTEMPHKGSLPRTLVAYGVIKASPAGGSETMSLLRGGQVTDVLTSVGQTVHQGQATAHGKGRSVRSRFIPASGSRRSLSPVVTVPE